MAEYDLLITMGRILLLLFLSFTLVNMQISDKRLCADKECKVIISTVKALGRHVGDHPLLLTFDTGDEVSVFSKSAGNNPHLWGGEVNGRRGYFEKNFVQETRVFVENPEHVVDTEDDIFKHLEKPPPSVDEKMRRKKLNLDKDDNTGVLKEKKEDTQKDDPSLPAGDNGKNKDVEEPKKLNDLEDKKDDDKELEKDEVDDLFKMAEMVDKAPENTDENVEIKDNFAEDDDEEETNNEEDLEEDFWDLDDNIDEDDGDSYKLERDRFDTADLNSFLKNKLLPGTPSKAEAGDTPTEKETDSLKVEPEVSESVRNHRHEDIKNVEKQEVSDGSKDVDKNDNEDSTKVDEASNSAEGEDSNKVDEPSNNAEEEDGDKVDEPSSNAEVEDSNKVDEPSSSAEEEDSNKVDETSSNAEGEDSNKVDNPSNKAKSVSDEDAGERQKVEVKDNKEEPSKQETEDTHVDVEVDDPTELDESSPDEFDINKMEVVKSESSKEVAESNGKQEVKTFEEEKSGTDLRFESEDDVSRDDNQGLKSEHSSESDKSHDSEGTHERNKDESRGEETVVKDKVKEDAAAEATLEHDLKQESESSEAKNVEDKSAKIDETAEEKSSAGDKSVEGTKLEQKLTAVHEEDGSDVTPDTLLDASSPEFNTKVDSVVLEKSKLESEVERKTHQLENTASIEADKLSEKSSSPPDQDEGIPEKERSVSKSSIVEHVDEGDMFIGTGFLHSSRAQLEDSDLPRETPKLNINPTSALISEKISNSQSSQLGMESSKADDLKVDASGNKRDKKLTESEEFETIKEGGSTIIINKEGEVVTAILPEVHSSQTSDKVVLTSLDDVTSTLLTNSGQLNPTAIESLLKPSQTLEELKEVDIESPQKSGNNFNLSKINIADIQLENSDSLLESKIVNKDYESVDFNSRKVLSVEHSAAATQQQQQLQPPSNSGEQPAEEKKQQKLESVIPTPVVSPPSKISSEVSSTASVTLVETPSQTVEDADTKESTTNKKHSSDSDTAGQIKQELLPDQQQQPDGAAKVAEAATEVPTGHVDLPPSENAVESAQTPEDTSATTEDYGTDSVYHSRKINDEDLMNEEEQKFTEPSQGFFKKIVTAVERQTKDLVEKLPPSLHSVLESFGLLANMKLVVVTFAVALLISMTFISCCSSGGGSNKKLQRQMLVKFDELEKKRLIDIKERQNMEDEISNKEAKNLQMKEEIEKLKEETKKNKSELQTIQLHNETLKKQLASFQSQVEELKENASSKQGEVKQQSKKAKDLEKMIKRLEERERNLEQTAQKLTSDLKHKDEEVVLLTSKIAGFTDLVGHLQTSKDQLLAEADDWKEKLSCANAQLQLIDSTAAHKVPEVFDLKERLEQREEEFKQMQETIMFKENELEVLKDCFLQLKAFEESEEGEEDAENASARVQEKIASMMDVLKMNASLIALEEEKNSLVNKLQIELEARRELEEQLESSRRSLETSMTDKMKAERQYQEAQTKFNVLSSYFKEKEMQLQRELGEHEALKKQNQNKLVSADETTKTVQQELDFIRTQNESLKRELASSERDFRSQIAANEKKAHENWLSARAAERELKEARHEAGVLRQKLTDIERRQFMGPGGIIRPMPTRIPPSGIMNGPPPPGMERSPSRGSLPPMPPIPPPHLRDEDFLASRGDRGPLPFPLDMRRGPMPPPGMRPPLDARSPPPRLPPFGSAHSPPPRMPLGMMDGRSPPPYDRRLPPHMSDRRLPPPDMLPPPLRGGPLPPHFLGRGGAGSPPMGPDSPHLDGRYPLPPYGRNPPHPSDRPSPKQSKQMSPQQSQV